MMSLLTSQLGPWRNALRSGVRSRLTTAAYTKVSRDPKVVANAGDLGQQILILRALIEDFGGEATGTALSKCLSGSFEVSGWDDVPFNSGIRALLAELGKCGAVTLEDLSATDVIVRITRDGAALADDLHWIEPGSGTA